MSDEFTYIFAPATEGITERFTPQALWPAGGAQEVESWEATSEQALLTLGTAEVSVRLHRESWDRAAVDGIAGVPGADVAAMRPVRYRILKHTVVTEVLGGDW